MIVRTKVPIITFNEIFDKSKVTRIGQRPMVNDLLPKLMDGYFARSQILQDTDLLFYIRQSTGFNNV